MSKLAGEFREFIGRNNIIGLAIAVVLGAAFGAVVASFVNDVLMQLIAAIGGRPDFSNLAVSINGTPIRYGRFLNAVLTFLIVGAAMFLVAKGVLRLQRAKPEEERKPESEVDVLRQIRDDLRTRPATH
jgi:large conductance mechanosensitive channel